MSYFSDGLLKYIKDERLRKTVEDAKVTIVNVRNILVLVHWYFLLRYLYYLIFLKSYSVSDVIATCIPGMVVLVLAAF